jgi:bifunctional DNase/RNase
MVKVEIDSIRVSLMSQDRVVVLKDVDSERYLPIWIGAFEAEAIRVELQNVPVTRPLTHDLLKSMILELGGEVEQIVVSDLRNDIFYARIFVNTNGRTIEVDSRPSDAIALGVRLKVPIFVEETVMDRAAIEPEEEINAEPEAEEPRELIEGGKPPDPENLSAFSDFLDTLDMDLEEGDEGDEDEDDKDDKDDE